MTNNHFQSLSIRCGVIFYLPQYEGKSLDHLVTTMTPGQWLAGGRCCR